MGTGIDGREDEGVCLGQADNRGRGRVLGVDRCRDFRFIRHLFLDWMSLLADNYQMVSLVPRSDDIARRWHNLNLPKNQQCISHAGSF
jgi:hypothetical protein